VIGSLDLATLTCVCGVSVAWHRIGQVQVSCAEARDRQFIFGETVPPTHERVERRPRGTKLSAGRGYPAQRVQDLIAEGRR